MLAAVLGVVRQCRLVEDGNGALMAGPRPLAAVGGHRRVESGEWRAKSEGRRRGGEQRRVTEEQQRGLQYLLQRKAEKLLKQRRESNDGGRARRGCREFDGDGSSVPSLPRRCSSVHWTVTRVVGAANDGQVKKQAEKKNMERRGGAAGEEVVLQE